MPTISEEQLSKWTQPAFGNEDARRENTEKVIGDAIRGNDFLAKLSIDVYAKGSYANNTNVRRDSDVDIAVEWTDWAYVTKTNQAADLPWERVGVPLAATAL